MKSFAMITEYNPFHNGHLYLLEKARKVTGADYGIALMSGNFMQRGMPSICDKYSRARMAALSGVDLVLELPFVYATGSAYDFSYGAVSILNKLNSIDYLCFGAECDDIDIFYYISDIINDEPSYYLAILKENLKYGMSYPAARQKALIAFLNNKSDDLSPKKPEYTEDIILNILSKPNNILALEYISALKRTSSPIKPIIIKRVSSMYDDPSLKGSISSALAIRNIIYDNQLEKSEKKRLLSREMPKAALEILTDMTGNKIPIFENALMPFIQSRLLSDEDAIRNICDMSDSLYNKLIKSNLYTNYADLTDSLKTKEITEARIRRTLLHLILDYKENDRTYFYDKGTAFYANILSFKKEVSNLLKYINEKSSIPLITKKSDFEKYLNKEYEINENAAKRMWKLDMKATKLYGNIIYNSIGTIIPNDYIAGPSII